MAEVEVPDPEELSAATDRFSKRAALMTAVYAVILAVASLGGSNAMKEMLLAQQEASNQWAYYQAKAIRLGSALRRVREAGVTGNAGRPVEAPSRGN